MPEERQRTYSAEALEATVEYLSAYLMKVRAIAQRMRDDAIPELTITMEPAGKRAAADVKRWSRSVEDALDRWILDHQDGNSEPKPHRRGKKSSE
jgi:hypothetical protein